MFIDAGSLGKALAQLDESLGFLDSDLAKQSPELRRQFRAAAIQAFEYTYELSVKLLRRQLAQIVPSPETLKEMNFMDLIRRAAESGLVKEVPIFQQYREMRNLTSHTYDEAKAEQVLALLPRFRDDASFILAEIRQRNDRP